MRTLQSALLMRLTLVPPLLGMLEDGTFGQLQGMLRSDRLLSFTH